MKPLLVVVGLFAAVAAGAAGGFLAAPAAAPIAAASSADRSVAPAPVSNSNGAAAPAVALDSHAFGEQIDALSAEVARLRAELASIKEGRVRESALPEEVRKSSAAVASDEEFVATHRNAILRVLADERADAARKADEERKQKDQEAAQQRAERVAKELGLNTAQRNSLADIYVAERQKREEFMKAFREGNVPDDREQMRANFQQYRDWRTNELNTRLGADVATRVTEYEGDRGMGFGGGGFGGPRGEAGANGGGGGGGGRNRNRNGGGNNGGGGNGGNGGGQGGG